MSSAVHVLAYFLVPSGGAYLNIAFHTSDSSLLSHVHLFMQKPALKKKVNPKQLSVELLSNVLG